MILGLKCRMLLNPCLQNQDSQHIMSVGLLVEILGEIFNHKSQSNGRGDIAQRPEELQLLLLRVPALYELQS